MLKFTDRAREMVRAYMGEGDGAPEVLRIAMEGSPVAPEFELTLVSPGERREDERELDVGGFTVLVAEGQAPTFEDAVVDFVERVNESGFEVRTKAREGPGAPSAATVAAIPQGPIADRVREVLNDQVNPAIAAHGGEITLVDVSGTEIYLEMSGGCQGCAMSRMTLRQGVERMLQETVPELTAVHDITDHASGEDPYYQAPT